MAGPIRKKSDTRNTLVKIEALKAELKTLYGNGETLYLLELIEQEVEILLKCQQEMRKTIKSKTYG